MWRGKTTSGKGRTRSTFEEEDEQEQEERIHCWFCVLGLTLLEEITWLRPFVLTCLMPSLHLSVVCLVLCCLVCASLSVLCLVDPIYLLTLACVA